MIHTPASSHLDSKADASTESASPALALRERESHWILTEEAEEGLALEMPAFESLYGG